MSKKMEFEGVSEVDVLLGRGGGICNRPGNIRYRQIIYDHRAAYAKAKKHLKLQIAKNCVQMVVNSGGRFLDWDNESKSWAPVKALRPVEKTSQALRENGKDPVRAQTELESKAEKLRGGLDQKADQDKAQQFSSVAHLKTLHGIPISFDILKNKQQKQGKQKPKLHGQQEEEQRVAQHQKEQKEEEPQRLQQEQLTSKEDSKATKSSSGNSTEAISQSQLQEFASMLYAANQTAQNNWLSLQQSYQVQKDSRPPGEPTASSLESKEDMPVLLKDCLLNHGNVLPGSSANKPPAFPNIAQQANGRTFGSAPPPPAFNINQNPAQKSQAATFGHMDEHSKSFTTNHLTYAQQAAAAILLSQQANVAGKVDPNTQMLAALFGQHIMTANAAKGGNNTASTDNAASTSPFTNNTSMSNTQRALREKYEMPASMESTSSTPKQANGSKTESVGTMQPSGQDHFGGNTALSLAITQAAWAAHNQNKQQQQPQNGAKEMHHNNNSSHHQPPNISHYGIHLPQPRAETRQHKFQDTNLGSDTANFSANAGPQRHRSPFAGTASSTAQSAMTSKRPTMETRQQQQKHCSKTTAPTSSPTAAAKPAPQTHRNNERHQQQERPTTTARNKELPILPGVNNAEQLCAGTGLGASSNTTPTNKSLPQKDVDIATHDLDEIRCLLRMSEGGVTHDSGGVTRDTAADAAKKSRKPLLLRGDYPNERSTKQRQWKLYRGGARPRRNDPFEHGSQYYYY